MKKDEAKTLSNAQRAVAQMRKMIFSGELPPGSNHLENELATRLGMSRTPVREASLTLESQGLVALRPRKGVRILPVSSRDMAEIYDILTELESMSARLAAARELSAKDLAVMETALGDMDRALAQGTLEDWAEADQAFHAALVELGGNSRAMTVFEMMSDQVRHARGVTLSSRPKPLSSNKDHRLVFEKIKSGDATTASELHRAHRISAKKMMLDLLDTKTPDVG